MATFFQTITPELSEFIQRQPMFFVASAPLSSTGRVNLSPKGLDTFRILSDCSVAYLDLTGSGNETSAHLLENGRITFMFCSFDVKPMILRLYGTGQTVLPDSPQWAQLLAMFPNFPGTRQIILAQIDALQTSCGFAVPLMQPAVQRDTLLKWSQAKGPEGLNDYRQKKNTQSIDALPTPLATQNSPLPKP